jgi:hypothetical protein
MRSFSVRMTSGLAQGPVTLAVAELDVDKPSLGGRGRACGEGDDGGPDGDLAGLGGRFSGDDDAIAEVGRRWPPVWLGNLLLIDGHLQVAGPSQRHKRELSKALAEHHATGNVTMGPPSWLNSGLWRRTARKDAFGASAEGVSPVRVSAPCRARVRKSMIP